MLMYMFFLRTFSATFIDSGDEPAIGIAGNVFFIDSEDR